jgi:hypothetical protein
MPGDNDLVLWIGLESGSNSIDDHSFGVLPCKPETKCCVTDVRERTHWNWCQDDQSISKVVGEILSSTDRNDNEAVYMVDCYISCRRPNRRAKELAFF